MSVKRRQPGSDKPPAVVPELDGQNVSIGGYVVPLDKDSIKNAPAYDLKDLTKHDGSLSSIREQTYTYYNIDRDWQ